MEIITFLRMKVTEVSAKSVPSVSTQGVIKY